MKRIKVKRLIYSHDYGFHGELFYGNEEFIGTLSDYSILACYREIGSWAWANSYGSMLVKYTNDRPLYMKVHTFYQYQKSWYNLLIDNIKRILRI